MGDAEYGYFAERFPFGPGQCRQVGFIETVMFFIKAEIEKTVFAFQRGLGRVEFFQQRFFPLVDGVEKGRGRKRRQNAQSVDLVGRTVQQYVDFAVFKRLDHLQRPVVGFETVPDAMFFRVMFEKDGFVTPFQETDSQFSQFFRTFVEKARIVGADQQDVVVQKRFQFRKIEKFFAFRRVLHAPQQVDFPVFELAVTFFPGAGHEFVFPVGILGQFLEVVVVVAAIGTVLIDVTESGNLRKTDPDGALGGCRGRRFGSECEKENQQGKKNTGKMVESFFHRQVIPCCKRKGP